MLEFSVTQWLSLCLGNKIISLNYNCTAEMYYGGKLTITFSPSTPVWSSLIGQSVLSPHQTQDCCHIGPGGPGGPGGGGGVVKT